ncbi:MAG: transporter [Ignavibacteriae bacterium]|nr:transporter [Ignavibacteriota bacterium]
MKKYPILVLIILSNILCFSQETETQFSDAIEDNSFFIEEAYNQEDGVVQHIFNSTYFTSPEEEFVFTFTQEWWVVNQTHQFSYTIPYSLESRSIEEPGDILLNYRYQLTTHEDEITTAPRLSFMFPSSLGRDYDPGDWGIQFNLPISKRMSNDFITHINAGMTWLPNAIIHGYTTHDGGQATAQRALFSYNIGASLIYLADEKYNFMLEVADNINANFDTNGDVVYENELIISPGFRYAIDTNSLQCVPGIAVPIRISEEMTNVGLFFYLSFEHPFLM